MKSNYSFLTRKIIQKRFGTIQKTKKHIKNEVSSSKSIVYAENEKQNFNSIISTGIKENMINEMKQKELDNYNTNEITNFQTNEKESHKKENLMNISFPHPFPSELEFLSWMYTRKSKINQKQNQTVFFEKNQLTWLQFHIACHQADCLIMIVDWRDFDFFFEPDILHLKKKVVCLVNKIDLSNYSEYLSNIIVSNGEMKSNIESNIIQNKFFDNFAKKLQMYNREYDVSFFPFSCKNIHINVHFLNHLKMAYNHSFALIGYPNVGKSSILKFLTSCVKIKISSTPGKTKYCQKYFSDGQKLNIESKTDEENKKYINYLSTKSNIQKNKNYHKEQKGIIFYDVPGLVFKRHELEHLILNCTVNVDQVKIDYVKLLQVILSHVSLESIFKFFKISLTNNIIQIGKSKNKCLFDLNIDMSHQKNDEYAPYLSYIDVLEQDRSIGNDTNIDYQIILDKISATFHSKKHWTREIYFRKIIKYLFNGQIERNFSWK